VGKSRTAKPWTYDHSVGRWRHGGRYAAKPSRRVLRRDRAGNYIDDAGKRVPASALAQPRQKSAKPAKPAKSTKLPKKAKKAKKAKAQKRPKKPTPPKRPKKAKSPVRPKSRFRGQESLRRVMREIAGERPKSRPTRAAPEIERIPRGQTIVEREFTSSSFRNNKRPENLGEIHANMLDRLAAKGPFQPDDIAIYEHGLKFVGHLKLDADTIAALSELVPPGGRLKYADTKAGTEVYVYLGSEPKLGNQVSQSYDRAQDNLQRIYDVLLDYWDMVDWYEWFETDESLYG